MYLLVSDISKISKKDNLTKESKKKWLLKKEAVVKKLYNTKSDSAKSKASSHVTASSNHKESLSKKDSSQEYSNGNTTVIRLKNEPYLKP